MDRFGLGIVAALQGRQDGDMLSLAVVEIDLDPAAEPAPPVDIPTGKKAKTRPRPARPL